MYWQYYREIWNSQYLYVSKKGEKLIEFHQKIMELLPEAILHFEDEFNIKPGAIKEE